MSVLFITMLVSILCGGVSYAVDPSQNEIAGPHFVSFTGEIKGNRVRLRLAPSTEGPVVKEFSKGDIVAVVGEVKDYYVVAAPEGIRGYVFHTFVLDDAIEGERVNVRAEPSTTAPILTRLTKGTRVHVLPGQSQGKWVEIQLPSQCTFYVAKNFVANKGPLDLYRHREGQKRIALDLLESAKQFAREELSKTFDEIDLDVIYKKIGIVQSSEFEGIPELQPLIQRVLAEVQDTYLARSLEREKQKEETTVTSSIEGNPKSSLLSQHIRRQVLVKTSPSVQGRESLEYALFKIWAGVQSQEHPELLTQDAFYQDEQRKKQVLTGELELYPHVVKNKPGDYLLRDGENPMAFVYATAIDLDKWLGKRVTLECLPRPNNNFAFPAYYVISIKE